MADTTPTAQRDVRSLVAAGGLGRAFRKKHGWVNVVGFLLLGLALAWLVVNFVKTPALFLNVLWIGITVGAIYGLVALGYTLVYGILELINFAHGDVFALCGLMTTTMVVGFALDGTQTGLALWGVIAIILVLAMLFGAAVNTTVELVAYRKLRGAPRLVPMITAIGMSFIVQQIGLAFWGSSVSGIEDVVPKSNVFDINGVSLTWDKVAIWVMTIPVLLGLVYLVQRTKPGKAMRAVAQDRDAAAIMGISVNRTISFTFALAGALAGAAGVLYALYFSTVRFDTGFRLGIVAFTAAVLGGIGNLTGAMLGGMVIGLVQAFNEGLTWLAMGPDWSNSVIFTILILILIFRPEGILGEKTPEGQ